MPLDRPESIDARPPQLGAFLTMTVGLLLFFGAISRIHEYPGLARPTANTEQRRDDLQQRLEDERARTLVVIGSTPDMRHPERRVMPRVETRLRVTTGEGNTVETLPAVEIPDLPRMIEDEPATPSVPPRVQPERRAPASPAPRRELQRPARQHRAHVVQPGDRLWDLAKKTYGSGTKWRAIAAANPHINPDQLQVGQVIQLPDLAASETAQADVGYAPIPMSMHVQR